MSGCPEGTFERAAEGRCDSGKDRLKSVSPQVRALLFLIWLYRVTVNPLIPPCCRFTPSCSEYALQALKIHGFWKGTCLSILRIVRCNPFCEGGYDPVPPKKNWKRKQS